MAPEDLDILTPLQKRDLLVRLLNGRPFGKEGIYHWPPGKRPMLARLGCGPVDGPGGQVATVAVPAFHRSIDALAEAYALLAPDPERFARALRERLRVPPAAAADDPAMVCALSWAVPLARLDALLLCCDAPAADVPATRPAGGARRKTVKPATA